MLGYAASDFVGGVVGTLVRVPHKGAGAAEHYGGSCSKCTQASQFWFSGCPSRTVGGHTAVAAPQLVYDAEDKLCMGRKLPMFLVLFRCARVS